MWKTLKEEPRVGELATKRMSGTAATPTAVQVVSAAVHYGGQRPLLRDRGRLQVVSAAVIPDRAVVDAGMIRPNDVDFVVIFALL